MAQVIEFPVTINYVGKMVSVSPETPLTRFQCKGFVVFRNSPQTVPPDADMASIHAAIIDGRLLELAPGTAIKSRHASLNPASELGDTDKKAYTFITKEGLVVLTPESPEQAAAIDKELQENGHLKLENYPQLQKQRNVVPHLTGITITDLEPENPDA